MKRVQVALAGVLTFFAGACMPKGPPSSYRVLGATAAPLRAAFNADIGKVRIIMLVAPT
jgi:hypothetical protein